MIFSSCNDDDETGPGDVQIQLSFEVDGDELVFDDMRYLSQAGHSFSVIRLKFYLSNIVLHEADGNFHPVNNIFYIDATEASSATIPLGEIPEGRYTSMSFDYGLDETVNVNGGLPNTFENINMEWPIPGDQGYHYMKFEGKYNSFGTGEIKNFNLHTGATGGNQNYISYNLDLSDLTINQNNWTIGLDMDLNEWLENPHIYDFDFFGPMIMANQDAQVVLRENGLSVISIGSVTKN
jgi:hypothetical protein